MPLVVVTNAEEKSRSGDADAQAAHLLRVADLVFEGLGLHFETNSFEVWDSFPRTWLGGKPIVPPTQGRIRPRDFRVPLFPSEDPGRPLAAKVHGNHCIVLRGSFTLANRISVPAAFEINLARRYAKGKEGVGGVGDIVFETQKTIEAPWDGLYELLRHHKDAAQPFLADLESSIFHINERITEGPRVRWASLKAREGASEPVSDTYFLYRRDDQRIPSFVRGKLLELALERGRGILEEMELRSVPVFRSEVESMIESLAFSRSYDRATAALGHEFGLVARTGGSVMFYSTNPEAATKIAQGILAAIGPAFWTELRRRLGATNSFDEPLEKLASEHASHTLTKG
jgi:hypothetical protein